MVPAGDNATETGACTVTVLEADVAEQLPLLTTTVYEPPSIAVYDAAVAPAIFPATFFH